MSRGEGKPFHDVMPVAVELVERLRLSCDRVEIAGSLRRAKPTVRDIEIVAIPIRPVDMFGTPVKGPSQLDRALDDMGVEFTSRGQKYQSFTYNGHKVDLFLCDHETWGSIFTIRTGSADFAHQLVSGPPFGICPPSIKFRDGRLWQDGRLLVTREEEDVFAAVGLRWIGPGMRTGFIPKDVVDHWRVAPVWKCAE